MISTLLPPTINLIQGLGKMDDLEIRMSLLDIQKMFYDPLETRISLDKGIHQQGLKLQTLVDTYDNRAVISIVSMLIKKFCSQFNLQKNMTDKQCTDLATEIVLEEAHKWRIEELVLFFDRAGKGDYGRPGDGMPYERIDKAVIESLMDKYFATDRSHAVWRIEDDIKNELLKGQAPVERSVAPMSMADIPNRYEAKRPSEVIIPGITTHYTPQQIDELKNQKNANDK